MILPFLSSQQTAQALPESLAPVCRQFLTLKFGGGFFQGQGRRATGKQFAEWLLAAHRLAYPEVLGNNPQERQLQLQKTAAGTLESPGGLLPLQLIGSPVNDKMHAYF
jgi:hypothetical protein